MREPSMVVDLPLVPVIDTGRILQLKEVSTHVAGVFPVGQHLNETESQAVDGGFTASPPQLTARTAKAATVTKRRPMVEVWDCFTMISRLTPRANQ
jgi:hypothetical protein